jgi:hypothetical protein
MAEKVYWTPEAERVFKEMIPFIARPIAKKFIENYARETGQYEITPEVMLEARQRREEEGGKLGV